MKKQILDIIERAAKTAAQTAAATITVGAAVSDVNWGSMASVAGLSAILSILTSLVSLKLGDTFGASIAINQYAQLVEKVVKTGIQTLIATIGTQTMIGQVNWIGGLSVAAVAMILTLLTNFNEISISE